MNRIHYLDQYFKKCNLPKILEMVQECDSWNNRDSQKKWREISQDLPEIPQSVSFDASKDPMIIGKNDEMLQEEKNKLLIALEHLIPWRKGPFSFFGIDLDAEWRSDYKWQRIENHLPDLTGKNVLDIGCNNGYYMFKILNKNPQMVLGIDPIISYKQQFELLNRYAQKKELHFENLVIDQMVHFGAIFDCILYMGIIYHHKNPLGHLELIHKLLRPGGTIVFETMGIPGEGDVVLTPKERYAMMRNVWFVPTVSAAISWLKRTHFKDIQVVAQDFSTTKEQRSSRFCPERFYSFDRFIDQNDPTKTVEGYPAPIRFAILAKK